MLRWIRVVFFNWVVCDFRLLNLLSDVVVVRRGTGPDGKDITINSVGFVDIE